MTLATRKPTGEVAFPLLLIEGVEKTGKTYAALSLSASERVGRRFVLELDEPTADEYASLGDFEILEHNGTFTSILEQLTAATKEPAEDGKPNVIILDTGSALWGLLKDWASYRARNSRKAKKTLEEDPDAEVDISMNLWNDAKDRWYSVINLLRAWPGIGIIVARGREVAKVVNGTPVANQTEWSVEAEKSTPFAVSAVLRMTRPHVATLMSARSLHVDVPGKGQVLKVDGPVEHLVFEILGAGGSFQASSAVVTSVGRSVVDAKNQLVDIFKRSTTDEQEARTEALAVWNKVIKTPAQEVSDDQWSALMEAASTRIVERLQPSSSAEVKPADATPSDAKPERSGGAAADLDLGGVHNTDDDYAEGPS
jgi:hypothetical protein